MGDFVLNTMRTFTSSCVRLRNLPRHDDVQCGSDVVQGRFLAADVKNQNYVQPFRIANCWRSHTTLKFLHTQNINRFNRFYIYNIYKTIRYYIYYIYAQYPSIYVKLRVQFVPVDSSGNTLRCRCPRSALNPTGG